LKRLAVSVQGSLLIVSFESSLHEAIIVAILLTIFLDIVSVIGVGTLVASWTAESGINISSLDTKGDGSCWFPDHHSEEVCLLFMIFINHLFLGSSSS